MVERQVGAVDPQREQQSLVAVCSGASVAESKTPFWVSDCVVTVSGRSTPTELGQVATGTPVQRCVVDQPSTQAIGRS